MHSYLFFEEIDSTNNYLKEHYATLEDGVVVYCNHQTNGKGRRGRNWNDDHQSLMFSLLLKDNLQEDRMDLLPLLCGAAMLLTLKDEGIQASIKWPNDILIGDKKCTGILLEGVTTNKVEAIIIGIGINLNDESFPSELANKAISLRQATKKVYDKKVVLTNFIDNFDLLYSSYLQGKDDFMKIVQDNSYLTNKEVFLNYYGENKYVLVLDISFDGKLVVKDQDKIIKLNSGEVTLEKNYH